MESPAHLTEDAVAGSLSEQLRSDVEGGFSKGELHIKGVA